MLPPSQVPVSEYRLSVQPRSGPLLDGSGAGSPERNTSKYWAHETSTVSFALCKAEIR